MIDTDKYEWDSKCRLVVINGELYQRGSNGDYHISEQLHDKAVAQIVADAPLLLQEVKRLREENEHIRMLYEELYLDWRKMWDTLDNMGKAGEMRQHFPNTFPETMEMKE